MQTIEKQIKKHPEQFFHWLIERSLDVLFVCFVVLFVPVVVVVVLMLLFTLNKYFSAIHIRCIQNEDENKTFLPACVCVCVYTVWTNIYTNKLNYEKIGSMFWNKCGPLFEHLVMVHRKFTWPTRWTTIDQRVRIYSY